MPITFRKLVLLAHLLFIGAWIGLDVAMGVLVFTARLSGDPQTAAVCYQALGLVAGAPLAVSSVGSLVSGVALGLGTKWGLVKYWWVAVKLVLNLVLTGLVWLLLRPGLAAAVEYGRLLAAGQPGDPAEVAQLLYPPIVSTTALIAATLLSVYKPWGRVRRPAPAAAR